VRRAGHAHPAIGARHPEVIRPSPSTVKAIEGMAGLHKIRAVDSIHLDARNKIVTTPAYRLAPRIRDVALGIEKLVAQVMGPGRMADGPVHAPPSQTSGS
jgi:enhancing lycopene biosynthesis protein 2